MGTRGRHSGDVAIVGCGPVGALLANLLGLYGLPVFAFDREMAAYTLPALSISMTR